jgi:hypothetical protein
MTIDPQPTCPVARMDPLAREFLAQCHAEAHHCGRDYPWHVLEGAYWQVA